MRYFLDTELSESSGGIQLLSIGLVAEDRREFYAVSSDFRKEKCNSWVRENVIPLLGEGPRQTNVEIAEEVLKFVDFPRYSFGKPEFWGYYADYDWVVFCWLFGGREALPKGFPMYCRDLKQEMDRIGIDRDQLPSVDEEHNALADARWNRKVWRAIHEL